MITENGLSVCSLKSKLSCSFATKQEELLSWICRCYLKSTLLHIYVIYRSSKFRVREPTETSLWSTVTMFTRLKGKGFVGWFYRPHWKAMIFVLYDQLSICFRVKMLTTKPQYLKAHQFTKSLKRLLIMLRSWMFLKLILIITIFFWAA